MPTSSCVVVDYGIGNVFSVTHALQRCGVNAELTADHDRIRMADRVILPGVGAFGSAMQRLKESALDQAILDFIASGKPFLGICVGMQVLMEIGHEFGKHAGLGVIPGAVEKIDFKSEDGTALRVPVIGWNTLLQPTSGRWKGSPLSQIPTDTAFYFVHSFCARPHDSSHILANTSVGADEVVAAVQHDNVLGVQFHPERSADGGQRFLSVFLDQ